MTTDMTLTELSVIIGQVQAQQRCDHAWFVDANNGMAHHESMLDRQAIAIMKLRADTSEAVSTTRDVVEKIAQHHGEHTQAIEMLGQVAERQHARLGTTLRGQVAEEVKRLEVKIDTLAQAASA